MHIRATSSTVPQRDFLWARVGLDSEDSNWGGQNPAGSSSQWGRGSHSWERIQATEFWYSQDAWTICSLSPANLALEFTRTPEPGELLTFWAPDYESAGLHLFQQCSFLRLGKLSFDSRVFWNLHSTISLFPRREHISTPGKHWRRDVLDKKDWHTVLAS